MDSSKNKSDENVSSKKRKLEDTSFKTSDESDDDVKLIKIDQESASKPACKYGTNCYRKNADHLKEFSHLDDSNGNINLKFILKI